MIWIGLALVIVAVAAALLIWIYLEANGILKHAVRALIAGKEVEANTRILRAIPDVNSLLSETDDAVGTIAQQAAAMAGALACTLVPMAGAGVTYFALEAGNDLVIAITNISAGLVGVGSVACRLGVQRGGTVHAGV